MDLVIDLVLVMFMCAHMFVVELFCEGRTYICDVIECLLNLVIGLVPAILCALMFVCWKTGSVMQISAHFLSETICNVKLLAHH
jgi:hypothetical protein